MNNKGDTAIKPFAPAAERNAAPILERLKSNVPEWGARLIEVGSGTGQHAVAMARHFRHLEWTTSDVLSQHAGIQAWLDGAQIAQIKGPIEFEVGRHQLPPNYFDLAYSANVLHIISYEKVCDLVETLGRCLKRRSRVFFYGPFNYRGAFTSESNREFDAALRARDSASGIRAFEEIERLMNTFDFSLLEDSPMPANNRFLCFNRTD